MALKTLFYGLEQCNVSDTGRTLFVNARVHADIPDDAVCVQWFKPYADALAGPGHDVFSRIEDISIADGEAFDTAFVLIPKNMVEARYLVAKALTFLKPNGALYCVADNKAGGTRLQKLVQQFGVDIVQQISKHKSRFVQAHNANVDQAVLDSAIKAGSVQGVDKIGFTSQSGVYGWDKIDKGSAVLLRHIPQDLKGVVADFGCGYGYLLQHILQQNNGIKRGYAIDADARALHVARMNVGDGFHVDYVYADLTKPAGIPARLDTIVMNPPFHEGKRTDSDIGIAFIETAAACLRRNGALYMVANNQLPYESALKDNFFSSEVIAQENGFKVFKAVV